MLEYYPTVRAIHVACVLASGLLFLMRGSLRLTEQPLANHAALRWLTYAIDTALLTAALMLATMLRQYPFVHAWLTVKVLLLAGYIVLGTFALRRARTRRGRLLAFVLALLTYGAIIGVARAHHPLGWWHLLVA